MNVTGGFVELLGHNSYTGGTQVTGGHLFVGNGVSMGSITGALSVGSSGGVTLFSADLSAVTTITSSGDVFFATNTSAASVVINLSGGNNQFIGTSTAAMSNITLSGAQLGFFGTSGGGSATFDVRKSGGSLLFNVSSSAGTATIHTESGGQASLHGDATAVNATFILDSGSVFQYSTNGDANVGSINGAGTIFTGNTNLVIGGDDASSMFSGMISPVSNGGLQKPGRAKSTSPAATPILGRRLSAAAHLFWAE